MRRNPDDRRIESSDDSDGDEMKTPLLIPVGAMLILGSERAMAHDARSWHSQQGRGHAWFGYSIGRFATEESECDDPT